jgi:hypothetical protein
MTVMLVLLSPASASAFNPATQSHRGACAQATDNVSQAVGNWQANGVVGPFAGMLGLAPTAQDLNKWLVIGVVKSETVTANNGCDGFGSFFDVGGRTLFAGEHVGVKVPANLRKRVCAHPGGGCQPVTILASVVFPTNCWNLNTGAVLVTIYVHPKPKPKPKPKIPKPSVTASFSCSIGGVVLRLSNGSNATASASFTVNGIHYSALRPGHVRYLTIHVANGDTLTVTVSSGKQTLINRRNFTNSCVGPPVPQPSATATLDCSVAPAGGVVVTLTNSPTATGPASFTVNGTAYGPIAPGANQHVTIPANTGAMVTVTVTSGGQTLVNKTITNNCTQPTATATIQCDPEVGGGTLTVTLSNGSNAIAPASFTITATGGGTDSASGPYGPVSPGASQPVVIPVNKVDQDVTVTVTSGGVTVLAPKTFPHGCGRPL